MISSPEPPPQDVNETWHWWRNLMPITANWAYFDHAAVAPLPQPTATTIARFAEQASQQGDTVWPSWAANLGQLRTGIADWLNASSDEVVLVPNTTHGINIVAEGIAWRAGDNVVIPGGEFPSNHLPWLNQQRHGVELRVVPSPGGRIDLDGIRRAVDAKTRLVSASWVGYGSGYRLPVADLCQIAHDAGALFFLDAIQGMGIFPLDVRQVPVDFLAADGHKWMLGPEGAGFAYLRRECLEALECTTVGWNSVSGRYQFGPAEMDLLPAAERFEGGSLNMLSFAALLSSLKLFWAVAEQHGADAIGNRVLELHGHLRGRLRERGAILIGDWYRSARSGILNFRLADEEPAATRQRLLEAGIVVSCRGGGVRVSMHVYNTIEELDRLVETLSGAKS